MALLKRLAEGDRPAVEFTLDGEPASGASGNRQGALYPLLNGEHDAHPARGITPARIHAIMRAAEEGDLIPQLELADDMEEGDVRLRAADVSGEEEVGTRGHLSVPACSSATGGRLFR